MSPCESCSNREILAGAFSLVAGYTDVITVVRWRGFATIMTGNLLLLGRSLFAQDPAVPYSRIFYITLLVTFCLGVVLYRVGEHLRPHRGASNIGMVLAAVMLVAEAVVSYMPMHVHAGNDDEYMLAGFTPIFGMLMAACTAGKLGAPTTLITGHLVTLTTLGMKSCFMARLTPDERQKATMSMLVVACMFLGAGCGVFAVFLSSRRTEGLLLPVPPCLAILLWCYDHLAEPRSLVKKMQQRVRQRRARKRAQAEDDTVESGDSTDLSSSDEDASSDLGISDLDSYEASAGIVAGAVPPQQAQEERGGEEGCAGVVATGVVADVVVETCAMCDLESGGGSVAAMRLAADV